MEATLVAGFGDIEGKVVWESLDDEASAFGDWNGVSSEVESVDMPLSSSKVLSVEIEVADLSAKMEKKPWLVFQECFLDLGESEDTSVATLSQLLQNSPAKPSQSPDTICDSASLWGHLLSRTNTLRRSEPKSSLHSHSTLVSALGITHPHCFSGQPVPYSLEDHETTTEELSVHPTAAPLIQTKLLAPSCQGSPPAFLYQISRHWLAQCTVSLQPQRCTKDLLQ